MPPGRIVFFTSDEDHLYLPAAKRWGSRLRSTDGGVYMAWSRGSKVDPASLGESEESAVLKAFVDWFALQAAERIIYTYQSSFGKTAAESTDAPNLDVNYTRCLAADTRWGATTAAPAGTAADAPWVVEWKDAGGVAYDVSQVPGANVAPQAQTQEAMRVEL